MNLESVARAIGIWGRIYRGRDENGLIREIIVQCNNIFPRTCEIEFGDTLLHFHDNAILY
jgi:hypothetical protein